MKWDPNEYDGIKHFNEPITSIWTPDIVLRDIANNEYDEKTKTDTRVQIYSDGTIIWYAQVIYTAFCNVKVRWFPFDTQVCDMIFLSWSYSGFEINLIPGKNVDNRYVANGVWDMVAVREKGRTFTFACCPEPYGEIQYRLVFKRHATFYISYMVLPCLLLSILSLLVFYLPSDCGEKLTLSITNLLALVVFQEIIAENMPPTAEDSPIIATYFTCMITMVCCSVISTGVVMHLSAISQPMPTWVKRIFLEKVPRFLCLTTFSFGKDAEGEDMENKSIFENHDTNDRAILEDGKVDVSTEGKDSVGREPKSFNDFVELVKYIKEEIAIKNDENSDHILWQRVSVIIDRMLLYLFSLFSFICTLYLGVLIAHGSEAEYNDILNELEEDWPLLK
ncbi:neuronal acetylcholine receptor subunit beta-2-like isoform X2 [Amphiura filiformis]